MQRYDVVVVGAGPAGLAAAAEAAGGGAKTLVLEMRAHIGGQTNPSALVPLEMVSGKLKDAELARFREIELSSVREKLTARAKLSLIDMAKLEKLLAAEAVARGAEIWINSPVTELLKDSKVTGVRAESGGWSEDVRCEVVIDAAGAGGQWSSLFLRKFMGADWQSERTAFTNEYLMANARERVPKLIFTSYFAPGGHAWVYPAGRGFAFVGISGVRIHSDIALDEFLGKQAPPSLAKATPLAAFRGQLPLQGPLAKTCGGGIMAVGGSAGHFYQLSGQGLRYALVGGKMAGEVAVEAITDGDVSEKGLSEYDRAWRSEFGFDFEVGGLLHSSLGVAQDRKTDELIRALKGSPSLRSAFLDVFFGSRLRASVKKLLKDDDMAKVFGRGTVEKVLALK